MVPWVGWVVMVKVRGLVSPAFGFVPTSWIGVDPSVEGLTGPRNGRSGFATSKALALTVKVWLAVEWSTASVAVTVTWAVALAGARVVSRWTTPFGLVVESESAVIVTGLTGVWPSDP